MRKPAFFLIFFFIQSFPLVAQSGTRLKSIDFEGNKILSDAELLEQMNTKPKKGIQKLLFWKKRPDFIPSVLNEDIDRLKSFYIRNGFLDPEVTYDLDSARSGRLVRANIKINENSFVRVRDIDITLKGDSLLYYLIDSVRPLITLETGTRFIDENVFGTQSILKKAFSNNGYPYTSVNHDIAFHRSSLEADIFFVVDPGIKSFFGNTIITGDSLISEKFIRKYLHFTTGKLYSTAKIDSSQQDLFDTDLFQYVVISSKKDSIAGNKIPVEVLVKELPRWKLETGAGYGSEDRIRLSAEITRLNFLGGARKLIFKAKTSYFLPFSFDLRFVQPNIFFPRLDLVINPFYLRQREVSYRIDRLGGSVNFLYKPGKNINLNFSYALERDKILEIHDLGIDTASLKHNKSVFTLGGQLNTTNDIFYPSKGIRLNATLSYAGLGFSSMVDYYKIDFSLVNYMVVSGHTVLASKISTGVIYALGRDKITPIEERYLIGGASSLRGWERHAISPLNIAGFPVGGNTMIEAGAELRFPVYEIFNGAVFVDAGNVWSESYRYVLPDLHYDAGIGLRVRTPIGPVRLDFATPVINDKPGLQFFLSVGQAF
jgi:outer membrane protein insertion porin family